MLTVHVRIKAAGLMLLFCSPLSQAAQVWTADFNTAGGFDGMTQFQNLNPALAMFNPSGASGGILQVQVSDAVAGHNNKGGRFLNAGGGAVGAGSNSFSAYYKFAWSQLAETSAEVWTGAVFMGDSQTNWTREVMGALFRHYKQGGDYFVNVGGIYGGVGIDYAGYHPGSGFVDLGPSALNTTYQLVVSWNNATHHIHNALYNTGGTLLADNDGNLDSATDYPNLHILSQSTLNSEINATNIKYLGWEDYVGSANQQAIIWDVDRVSYYNNATDAFNAVEVAAPTGACCPVAGACQEGQTQTACTSAGGIWQGAGTNCAQATCVPFDPGNEPWDVVYDGVGSSADNVPNHLRWDSPFDDDWAQLGVTFKLDSPTVGFMSVDRVTNSADHIKTGNIWFRDPILTYAAGITMEIRVLIKSNSNTDAFSMTSLDDGGSFGVHLSPNRIKAGNLAASGSGTIVPFVTTDTYHLYRLVRLPNSHTIRIYVDNNAVPIVTGSGTSQFAAVPGDPYIEFPRILIGDNENDTNYNANYTLDFVRYRRGATAPGQTPGTFPARVLPALPPAAPSNETFTDGYDGVGEPASSGWIEAGASSAFTQQPNGIMELNTTASPANARKDSIPTWPNKDAITIEARIKVLPDNSDRGFTIVANDQMGGTCLVLSPNKAELMHSYLPTGYATYNMNTTDDFHIYRFTRDAHGLYWHLYVDNHATPVVAHQHAEGDQISFSRVWFGDLAFPVPNNTCHVLIDYIRWHSGTNAPPAICHTPQADFDGDGDVDMDDFGFFQRCLTGSGGGVPTGCFCMDFAEPNFPIGDGDVDQTDFSAFKSCAAGANIPPACSH